MDNTTEKTTQAQQYTTTQHTIDNITYTIKSRCSESAAQTLQAKLEAIIGREIARAATNSLDI